MYSGVVYVAGPKSRWQGSIHPDEIIARTRGPWRWLVHLHLLNIHGSLDATRCGWALMRESECIEQYDPPILESHT